jgi:hypothetical protein
VSEAGSIGYYTPKNLSGLPIFLILPEWKKFVVGLSFHHFTQ